MNFPNRTLYGLDNLRVLREMDDATIDLIYLDPPFNKKEEFNSPLQGKVREEIHAFIKWFNVFNGQHGLKLCDRKLAWKKDFERPSFKDTWDSDEDFRNMAGWSAELEEAHPQAHIVLQCVDKLRDTHRYYKAHLSYLTFMAVRLVEMRRILKQTGSLYLHCDPTMSHWIKILMDSIFGEKNFRNEIVWSYNRFSRTSKKQFARMNDIIFMYSKTPDGNRFYPLEVAPRDSTRIDKGYHTVNDGGIKKLLVYDMQKAKKSGIDFSKYDRVVETKARQPFMGQCWTDIPIINPQARERVGYPTQKPLALLERIIRASTNEGDMVLDPFCGCATTCIAAHNLKRGYVGIDISEASYVLNVYRLYKEVFGWSKDGLFNGRGIGNYAEDTPIFSERPPKRTPSKDAQKAAYVYIIKNKAWPGQYKVGIAFDPHRRLNAYHIASPKRDYELEDTWKCLNARDVERAVHETFPNDYEWVQADLNELKDFIEKTAKRT